MEIGKNSASWKRPEFLDPDYDFVSKHDPHPRWDPERWHSSTKAAHMRNRKENHAVKENGTGKPDGMGAGKGVSGAEQNWRKKDKRASLVMDDEAEQKADEGEFRLGPQRRSYKEGCKPQNTKNDSAGNNAGRETVGNGGGGGTWREQRKNQRDNWRRGGPGDEDDKFRDFRKDDGGDQRDGGRRGNRYGREYDSGRNSRHDKYGRGHGGYGRHEQDDAEPEWMNDGPASHLDFMELGGFEDDHRGKQNNAQNRADSPELVAFDPAAFGGSEEADGGLGGALEGGVGGGDDALEADIDGLLGSIGNDILDGDDDDAMLDQSQGANQSRFTKFFESSKPDSPKKPSPPISGNIQRLDPNVWPSAEQMMPPTNRHVRPAMPPMSSLRPNLNQISGLFGAAAAGSGFPGVRIPSGINPLINPAQPMSLEELEGRSGPSPIDQSGPPPEIQLKLLNLSKQRNEFEQKNKLQNMMLLGGAGKAGHPVPHPASHMHDGLMHGGGLPFNAASARRAPTQMPPPFLDSRTLEPATNQMRGKGSNPAMHGKPVGMHDKSGIYSYLAAESKTRMLTPTEQKFLEKYEIEVQMAIDQNLNHFGRLPDDVPMPRGMGSQPAFQSNLSLERQKQVFDEKLRQQSGLDGRGTGQGNGGPGEPNQPSANQKFNQFTPTSVMRKMVRTREDGGNGTERERNSRSQKITALEYTGVTRVPKQNPDAARKLSGGNGNGGLKGGQPVGMRSLPGAPQVNYIPSGMMNPRGNPGQSAMGAIPSQQMMFQQLLMQRQMAQSRQAPPPTLPIDPFLAQHQRKHPRAPGSGMNPGDKTPTDENIHIQKLLNANRQQYPDFG